MIFERPPQRQNAPCSTPVDRLLATQISLKTVSCVVTGRAYGAGRRLRKASEPEEPDRARVAAAVMAHKGMKTIGADDAGADAASGQRRRLQKNTTVSSRQPASRYTFDLVPSASSR